MNYIAEIRAFYDWNMFNSIPADAQALWHTLMHLNNKCAIFTENQWLWRVEFTVANGTLESMLRFSRTQLDRMRNVLIQSGRISYRKGRGNQSGAYRFIPFDTQYVTQTVTQTDTQTVTQTVTQVWRKPGSLNNNNIYPNSNLYFDGGGDARAGAREPPGGAGDWDRDPDETLLPVPTPDGLYMEYFGRPPTEAERQHCKNILGIRNPEIVEHAFHTASKRDIKNFAFVLGILENYQIRGVKDLGDVADDDMAHAKLKRRERRA